MKEWRVSKVNKEEAMQISALCGLPPFLSMMLSVRGITSPEEINEFLSETPSIKFPHDIIDMDKAAERILKAVDRFEKICIFGDYDADGVTATALLYSYLEAVGANVMFYIPERETQGYGMNIGAVDLLKNQGVTLIVTVDNGICAFEEIDHANSLGIDTVVTDHHMPSGSLPNAVAVVDPHRSDCPSKFKELSGVGVAFKLIMALEGEDCDLNSLIENYSDLAAIGTVGDIVSLKSENRALVKSGIRNMLHTERVGILAMLEESGLASKPLTAGRLSFSIVPRINAVGRLGLSDKSVSLLLTEDEDFAREVALQLGEDNSKRKAIEKEILDEINKRVAKDPDMLLDRILVIDGEGWHRGVVGIVAARVKELTGKPVIIIATNGGEAHGSGRSVEGFSLCDAVFACGGLLDNYGGHPMAVGLGLKTENIDAFRKKINAYAKDLGDMPHVGVNIDCKLNPAQLSLSLVGQLKYLEPFGAGNPAPVFGLFGMQLDAVAELGGGKHLRLSFHRDKAKVNALLFFTEKKNFPYIPGDILDLAVSLDENEYNGSRSVSVIIKEIKFSSADSAVILRENDEFESLLRGERLSAETLDRLKPKRSEFALVYRFLQKRSGFAFTPDILYSRLDRAVSYSRLMVILKAMRELALIECSSDLYTYRIGLIKTENKVDLASAPIIRRITQGEIENEA